MDSFVSDYQKLIQIQGSPCISLYQPTHRSHPDNEQDAIRFKNLTKNIEKSLQEKYPERKMQSLLDKFHDLFEDYHFWSHNHDGLAILANSDFFKIYKLPRSVPELAIVADSFHVKPLIRIMQSADRYQVLAINRDEVKLFEGNRDNLHEVELSSEVPNTLAKALGNEVTSPRLTVATYGMGTKGPAMHHGHGGRKDEVDLDAERFFRIVDQAIFKHHSQQTKLPLILAALPEHHHLFHQVSHNPYLMSEGLKIDPSSLSLEELRLETWKLVEPHYLKRLKKLIEEFSEAQSKKLGSDQLADIGKAAITGKVATLLIDADQQIPGKIDANTGRVEKDELLNPKIDDVLDDLGQQVLKHKGEVIVVPGDKMPTDSGAAAIYRY
ncbi:hypothetical protein E3983_02860 [Legionella israelensis]|uniref:Uncharacterized protein n=1 Tax=Legionella israelensis TaxID=454 RepID=A0AAX1EEB8_9GAMM|nr:hypothetical protein [Legionella israelensis]QBR83399.1 hypothetical protein E3983_02860 [Legionella israelensis]